MRECRFASDNTSGVHPRILEALARANTGAALPYGDDPWTQQAENRFKTLFGEDIAVFLVPLGTGANTLALKTMARSWDAVLCSDLAHTYTTESGAVEAIVGCKMHPLSSVQGKIRAEDIPLCLTEKGSPHHNQPRVVALAQPTEVGTVYTEEEIRNIVQVAHDNGLFVHMDGARIANAAVALGKPVRCFTKDLGVDALSFGGTKNGMLSGEAVIFFNTAFTRDFPTIRKQCLQLTSKMRFWAAQFLEYFTDDLWLQNAAHANAMARLLERLLGDIPQVSLAYPVETNGIFAFFKPEYSARLQEEYTFYEVDAKEHIVRWMMSFDTTEEEVRHFAQAVRKAVN